jgi:ABC-type nitrate/sulfonate/bicarbonate transport system ATPase subunit/ABC-type nitrate/sulfonate/bicarbonate transport system permease component
MKSRSLRALGVGLLLCGYQALAWYAGWPGPRGIMQALDVEWSAGILSHDIEVSCARWMCGWIPGVLIGISLGLITGRIKAIRNLLEPSRLLLRALPFIGLVPVVTRLFGTSETGKRILIAWITCSVCWPMLDAASSSIPLPAIWRARTLGARPIDRARLVWGFCQSSVFSALRTSLSLGWILVALVEMVGVYERSAGRFWSEGLGFRLFRSQEEGQDSLLIGVLLVFALVGGIGEILLSVFWNAALSLSLRLRKRRILRVIDTLMKRSEKPKTEWNQPGNVRVEGLQTNYDGSPVFSGACFSVEPGETLAVLGKSGSGKTTLLRTIAGLCDDDLHMSGKVLIDGEPAKADQRIGIVFQDALVFPHMTVWENVLFGRRARLRPIHAYHLLVEFGIDQLATQVADTLSGGQRQRLALACALANAPQILLLDESFGALDAITRSQLQSQFVRDVRGKITCIFVTHDIAESIEVASKRVMVGIGAHARFIEVPRSRNLDQPGMTDQEELHLRKHLYQTLAELDSETSLSCHAPGGDATGPIFAA